MAQNLCIDTSKNRNEEKKEKYMKQKYMKYCRKTRKS